MVKKKTAVLISGRGSNMSALIRAAEEPAYPAEIAVVISDNAEAAGLQVARAAGIPARAIPRADYADRKTHEAAIEEEILRHGVEVVCLAGFMRMLSADFVARRQGRLINIHPSLLPLFPGLNTHIRALESGVRVHGCTVHFATAEMDSGPIIAQAAVPVMPDDTPQRLEDRVLKVEHRLYPLALALVASGKARMENGRTVYSASSAVDWGEKDSLMVPSIIEEAQNLEDLARRTP